MRNSENEPQASLLKLAFGRSVTRRWACVVLLASACSAPGGLKQAPQNHAALPAEPALSSAVPAARKTAGPAWDRLSRDDFNRRAVLWNVPLFWRKDAPPIGSLEPAELAIVLGSEVHSPSEFLDDHAQFTPHFVDVYQRLQSDPPGPSARAAAAANEQEQRRREAVRLELLQGRPSLIESDFSKESPAERVMVRHLINAARAIERLYARQRGTLGLETELAPDDPESAALFFRNQGPNCVAPQTEKLTACSALPSLKRPAFGLYPANIQAINPAGNASLPDWCHMLEKQPNARELTDHFSVVSASPAKSGYQALPYHVAFREDMEAVAAELSLAEAALGDSEAALKRYLTAAAAAFRTNQWESANAAWVAMDSNNSRYYLRVAPDEVYFEPCAWKAGFALTFARINNRSKYWRDKLDPIKQDLEEHLAELAGKPYRARRVGFKLPDFIDIVLNAGDSRHPHNATVGQSLPNWGPVAERGGRTVMMSNLYTDWDSRESLERQAASLLCKPSYELLSSSEEPAVLGVVLHEAAHNMGPSHGYQVHGRVDHAIFGGALASTLEELKAQSAALYLPSRLLARGVLDERLVQQAFVREIAWAFGHIALGMYDGGGRPKNYSQLAAIQLGLLKEAKLVQWKAEEIAQNGQDRGCFQLDWSLYPTATRELARTVLQIKSRGDKTKALELVARFVDSQGEYQQLRSTISERWLRVPKPSFLYAIAGVER